MPPHAVYPSPLTSELTSAPSPQGINDLQTEADRSAQRCIVANLARQFPRLTIIGEEEPDDRPVPEEWIVEAGSDPRAEALKCPEKLATVTEDQVSVGQTCVLNHLSAYVAVD